MSTLQCPIDGVKHRKEYPGGEQAYLESIPQNLYLAEVPINSSIAMMSGKYKRINARLNYKAITAEISGLSVTNDPLLCDDCNGEVTRLTTNKTKEQDIDLSQCQKDGVYSPGMQLDAELIYQSSENNLAGSIDCPDGSFSLDQMIGSLQETGRSEYMVQMTIQQTGYAKKPFHHDYVLGVNRQKGSGAKATFRIGDFSFKCDYKLESENFNGFIGPTTCFLRIVQEDAYDFEAVFAK